MNKLPIPESQLHYADAAVNDEAQESPIVPLIDRLQYPTLGAPALLTREQPLRVILSLPHGESPEGYSLRLVARHPAPIEHAEITMPIGEESGGYHITLPELAAGKAGGELVRIESPEPLGDGPRGKSGQRQAWRIEASLQGFAPRLYDLALYRDGHPVETQHNAVRIFAQITGSEQIVLCGDSQFHEGNEVCLERFVARMNSLHHIAWIAMIGDVCDNGVRSPLNMIEKATGAGPQPVRTYYLQEYPGAHARLKELNKPIVLVPGNHDGMCANRDYGEGTESDVFVGPDPRNDVSYDGLHYFRRTFGPLHFSFDWHKTRYLCLNSFELNRHQRLGFHGVVANWGGWMRDEQLDWLRGSLQEATDAGQHKVVFIHHDPRGGSMGKYLGRYNPYRPYRFQDAGRATIEYLKYILTHITSFQQEWMYWPAEPMDEHPVRRLLSLLVEHKVWNVVMGHDNKDWFESYFAGDDLFVQKPEWNSYAMPPPPLAAEPSPQVRAVAERLGREDLRGALDLLNEEKKSSDPSRRERAAEDVLAAAIEHMAIASDEQKIRVPERHVPAATWSWGLAAHAALHFVHVDDVGSYFHSREQQFARYGYAIAQLAEGRPISVQSYNLSNDNTGAFMALRDKKEGA